MDSSLTKAHSLSTHASSLTTSSNPSNDTLREAVKAFDDAADLFDEARGRASDAGAANTLQLLSTQNRKQARLLQRRISTRKSPIPPSTNSPVQSNTNAHRDKGDALNGERRRRSGTSTLNRSIPPFASPPSVPTAPLPSSALASSSTATITKPSTSSQTSIGAGSTISNQSAQSTYGSEDSSSRGEESFVIFGSAMDTSDPFMKFWNVLETALHDITNPVAFASAPLGMPSSSSGNSGGSGGERKGKGKEREREKDRRDKEEKGRTKDEKGKEKEKEKNQSPDLISSGTESFYLVTRDLDGDRFRLKGQGQEQGQSSGQGITHLPSGSLSTITATKSPEELALENVSLRQSLDAISLHAHALEREVKRLTERDERKEEMMRSVVIGVRREAKKVIQSQEIYRSQLLPLSQSPTNRTIRGLPMTDGGRGKEGTSEELTARISDLESQVKVLTIENEKQRTHLQKYRDRFEKLKLSSRNKREAKITPPPLAVVGEEDGGEG